MNHLTLTAVASAALLAACGQPAEKAVAPPAEPASEASMAAMPPSSSAATTGHGTGVLTAIDTTAGTVTLDHGPIPELGWPAMTMAFKAAPASLASIQPGDRVKFDLVMSDGAGEITAISKE